MKNSDEQSNTFNNHFKFFKKITLIYFLCVALGWAAYPLFFMLLGRHMTLNTPMAGYSALVSIVSAFLIVAEANDFGLMDRKPYTWAKYKAKGLVCGALVGFFIFLIELLVILIANSVFKVSHPQFNIYNLNSYLRMLLYSPFFWFYELVKKDAHIIPRVEIWSALFVVPFVSIFTEIGYLFGTKGIEIELRKRKKDE